jgi:hypothetical protein
MALPISNPQTLATLWYYEPCVSEVDVLQSVRWFFGAQSLEIYPTFSEALRKRLPASSSSASARPHDWPNLCNF